MTTRNSGVVGVSGNSNVKRSSTENPFTQKNCDQICANVLIPHAHCRQLQQLGCLHYFIISQCRLLVTGYFRSNGCFSRWTWASSQLVNSLSRSPSPLLWKTTRSLEIGRTGFYKTGVLSVIHSSVSKNGKSEHKASDLAYNAQVYIDYN